MKLLFEKDKSLLEQKVSFIEKGKNDLIDDHKSKVRRLEEQIEKLTISNNS